jgi:hypothetical protein
MDCGLFLGRERGGRCDRALYTLFFELGKLPKIDYRWLIYNVLTSAYF